MASDPNRWFELWDTFGSIFRSDGAAAAKLQLSELETGDLESLCGAAGIPVQQRGGGANREKMVEDLLRNLGCFREAGSGWVFELVRAAEVGCAREDVIFEDATRLNKKFETLTVAERLAFCVAVLRARGEDRMRQQMHGRKAEPVRDLARKLGISVKPSNKPKLKDRLVDEVMQLLDAQLQEDEILRTKSGGMKSFRP
eukprot:s5158_g1.t1